MSALDALLADEKLLEEEFRALPPVEQSVVTWQLGWLQKAHKHQIEPAGDWWTIWLMIAGRGSGKQLCVATKIPTPTGWVLNGDIKAGDTVLDERGNPCKVLVAHPPQMPKSAYRLTFSDGSTIDADGDHLWTTLTHRARKQMSRHGINRVPEDWASFRHPLLNSHYNVTGYCGAETLSTEEILRTLRHSSRGDLNHCIPTTQPLNLPEADLPVDPWLLGYWLGNGHSKEQVVTAGSQNGDFDDSHVIRMIGRECVVKREVEKGCTSIRIPGLGKELRAIGVLGNKHIPEIYLRASIRQRLALLRGLCDSDGYANDRMVEFTSTDLRIAQGVYELAVSLGEKATLSPGRAMLNGVDYGPKWRVTWRWNRFNPFSLPRKANRLKAPKAQGYKHGHRMIVSVEPIEPKLMRCLTVDSPSRLYLAGEGMIPTHNTRAAAETVGYWAWSNPKSRTLISAPTSGDIRGTCFEGDSGLLNVIPKELIEDYNKSLSELKLVNGSFIKGIPASEPERFRGGQWHAAWLDELAAWEYLQESWDMIQFAVRLGTRTRIICSTTPKPKDVVIDLLGREGQDVVVTRASTYVNIKNLAPSFQKQILQYEGTNLGRQEIHAEIIDPEEGGIVKREWFRLWPANKPFPKLEFIVQSYDCATSDKTINDPTGCITFGVFKPLDGGMSVMVLDCWKEHLTYPDLRPKVIKEFETVYGEGKGRKLVDLILVEDKSAGISLIQDLQRAHLPVHAYNPGRADKVQRLSIVANIIKAGRVWVPESTARKGYVRDWAEGMVSEICSFPEGTAHDEYVDCCVDSLTQVTMADGSTKAIKDVQVGDWVRAKESIRQVTKVHDNGLKEVWEVNIDGKKLLATADHLVYCNGSWVRVDSLTQAVHSGLVIEEGLWHSLRRMGSSLRSSCTTAFDTGDIPTLRKLFTGFTFRVPGSSYIEQFGKTITGQFRRGTTFITKMGTLQITTLATWNVCQSQPILQSTKNSGLPEAKRQNTDSSLSPYVPWRQLGIRLKRGKSGTKNTPSGLSLRLGECLRSFMKARSLVSGAVQKGLQKFLPERSSVLQPVKLPSLRSGEVRAVHNTHTMRHVFDLTVEGEHCYFANGILVHNCSQALRYLRDGGWLSIDGPPREEIEPEDISDAEIFNKKARENPYSA